MAWSYSGDPTTSSRDEVRFLIGDTDQQDQLLLDGEIDYILTVYPSAAGYSNYRAAAAAAHAVAAKYSRLVDKTVGSLSIQHSRKATAFAELANELDVKANDGHSQPVGVPQLLGGGDKFLMGRDWEGSAQA